jgi:hypothetical protein
VGEKGGPGFLTAGKPGFYIVNDRFNFEAHSKLAAAKITALNLKVINILMAGGLT